MVVADSSFIVAALQLPARDSVALVDRFATPNTPSLCSSTKSRRLRDGSGLRQNKGLRRGDNRAEHLPDSARGAAPFQKISAGLKAAASQVVSLSHSERTQLQNWVRQRTSPHGLAVRSRIVLLASSGLPATRIAQRLHVSSATVRLWTRRFERGGLAALTSEAPGRGRRPGMSAAITRTVLEATLRLARQTNHPVSVRRVAMNAGTSASTVWRCWKRCGVRPDAPIDALDAILAQIFSETPAHHR